MAITKSELQLRLQIVLSKLEQYKANYHHLQYEITNQEVTNKLWEHKNHSSQRDSEEIKKMLSDKYEGISQLKNHNQDLKDIIKKFEDNEGPLYRSHNDLEEDTKHLNKLIMDKDDELV